MTVMILDDAIVAVSPTSAYRVLKATGRLDRKCVPASKKVAGFVEPLKPHQNWRLDVPNIKVDGTFHYLSNILDGYGGAIVHGELGETMKEQQLELIVQKALEKPPPVSGHGSSPITAPRSLLATSSSSSGSWGSLMPDPALTIPSPAANSNAGTAASNASAFGRLARVPLMRPAAESPLTSTATTPFDCCPRSDTSRQPTNCKAWNR